MAIHITTVSSNLLPASSKVIIIITYSNTSWRGNFHGFSLNRESFPANYGLVDQQYKSTKVLQ